MLIIYNIIIIVIYSVTVKCLYCNTVTFSEGL